jgi:hypothetical protein
MYDECLRKTILDLKPAVLWDNFMEAGELFRFLYCRSSFYFLKLFYFYFWFYDGALLG